MATTKRIIQVLQKMGFEPEEGKSIVVSYAPVNLSDRIRKLFWNNYYSFSLCRESIVMLPFSSVWADVKKEVALELPYSSILGIEVEEDGLSYRIDIKLEDEKEILSLMAQQGELSELRSSGIYSLEDWTFVNNWHKNNMKETLEALKELGRK
ncbi:MAG: hypothetical protein K2O16_11315 [Lachnospiraceae bacterium]|nr:hypothetical protein [Lachnospiraceae bacterium]MDE7332798.1 hypothetical protein [Lachnospiraceae bacterium]